MLYASCGLQWNAWHKTCQFSFDDEERSLDLRKPNKAHVKANEVKMTVVLCQEWQSKSKTIVFCLLLFFLIY
jgi:hypothetical protein